jgi:hypothetical protein
VNTGPRSRMRFLVRWLALLVGLINIVFITIIYHTLGRLSRDNVAHLRERRASGARRSSPRNAPTVPPS